MKIQTMIMLAGGERYILRSLEEALNLVGWHDHERFRGMSTKDALCLVASDKQIFQDIKSIARVRSGQFSHEDLRRVDAYIRRMAAAKMKRADEGGVFIDPKLDGTFSDGVRSSVQLAIRQLGVFRDHLNEMINAVAMRRRRGASFLDERC